MVPYKGEVKDVIVQLMVVLKQEWVILELNIEALKEELNL